MNALPKNSPSPTLLIVDDEQLIIDLVSGFLSEFDYQIFTANDAHQAANILQQQAIDVMITDHQMPDVTGLTLCHNTKSLYPEIKMILTSGNVAQFSEQELSAHGVDLVLAKPISLIDLANDVEQLTKS